MSEIKKRKLLAKYNWCTILVCAKMGIMSQCGKKYCITDVKYWGHIITDHLRIRWGSFKGKWEVVYLEITIGEYVRADGTKDYWVKKYKYIPMYYSMWRIKNNNSKKKSKKSNR